MIIIIQGLTSALLLTQGYSVGVFDPFTQLQPTAAPPAASALGVAGTLAPPPLGVAGKPPPAELGVTP